MSIPYRRRIAVLASLLLLVLIYLPAYSQPADSMKALRLDDLIHEALANNLSLEVRRLEAQALRTRSRQVSALPDPSIGLTYQPRPILTARGYQRSQLRVEQMVPFPGKRALRGEIANLSSEIRALDADAFAQDLALRVKHAYFDLYRVQEQERLIADFQAELRSFEDAALGRYEVGTGSQQAVLKAQLERGRLQVRRRKLSEDRRAALHELARMLDHPDIGQLTGRLEVAAPPVVTGKDLLDLALRQRPEVQALRSADVRAERKLRLARKEFLPDFMIGAMYFDLGSSSMTPAMTGRDAFTVSAGIRLPLWRGRLNARVEEARIQERQVESTYRTWETALETHIADLRGRLREQEKQMYLLDETLLPQAETTLEATLSAYKTDRAGFLDLLDAERTLFSLRMDYEDTYVRYLKTAAQLERTLGTTRPER